MGILDKITKPVVKSLSSQLNSENLKEISDNVTKAIVASLSSQLSSEKLKEISDNVTKAIIASLSSQLSSGNFKSILGNAVKDIFGKHIVIKIIAGIAIGVYVGMMAHTLTVSIYQSIVN